MPGKLNDDEPQAHMHTATDLELEKILLSVTVEPFSSNNPPSDMSFLSPEPDLTSWLFLFFFKLGHFTGVRGLPIRATTPWVNGLIW